MEVGNIYITIVIIIPLPRLLVTTYLIKASVLYITTFSNGQCCLASVSASCLFWFSVAVGKYCSQLVIIIPLASAVPFSCISRHLYF